MHLVIYFKGTNESQHEDPFTFFHQHNSYAYNIRTSEDGSRFSDTLLVKGCADKEVCNALIFPNLKQFATPFTKNAFVSENKQLFLAPQDLEQLQLGIKSYPLEDKTQAITGLTLVGYSRGAVTCFEVARALLKLCPEIPVDIVANQPVPGSLLSAQGTNAASIQDCRQLKNLKHVSFILGAYTKEKAGFIGRNFMRQIVPMLPASTKRKITTIPLSNHTIPQGQSTTPSGFAHMHLQIAKSLKRYDVPHITEDIIKAKEEHILQNYTQLSLFGNTRPPLFESVDKLQSHYGINGKELYLYSDQALSTRHLRQGLEWDAEESLIAWWNKHQTTKSATLLTKQLIQKIKSTQQDDETSLAALFKAADHWLILKSNASSSRYYQVEALRNNIYQKLVHVMSYDKAELWKISYQLLKENHALLNRWNHASKSASFFKTNETKKLDEAFIKYDNGDIDENALYQQLNSWLENKKNSSTKRYQLVMHFRDNIQQITLINESKELAI